MKCSVCKNNDPLIHIEEYSDHGVRKLNLCLECAAAKGFNVSIEQIDKLLLGFLENIFLDNNGLIANQKNENSLKCPACGITIYEINESQKVGCPICYSTFKKVLDLIIYKNNNSLTYKGRLPDNLDKMRNQKTKLEDLKIKLNQCLLLEDYSNAAVIRDQIKALREKYKAVRGNNDSSV